MKKIRLICLLLAVLLLLTGCGKLDEAKQAIDAIGSVTMESGESIRSAEALVAELSERRQEKLPNLQELTDARAEFDRLNAAVDQANRAIEAIGEVTLSSENAIREAREAYDALEKDGLTGYASESYPVLTAAESQYTYLCAKAIYDHALECYDQDLYDDAMGLLEELRQQYPGSDFEDAALELDVKCLMGTAEDLFRRERYEDALAVLDTILEEYPPEVRPEDAGRLGARCYVVQATELYNQGEYEDALSLLSDGDEYYADEMDLEGGGELRSQIDEELERIRPTSGQIMQNQGYVAGGYCKFTVEADSTHDAVVKLERVDDPSKFVLFYVRAGEKATISIQPGTYYAKYTSGFRWYGEEAGFGRFASFIQADELMQFSVTYQDDYIYYSTITITLYTTVGGNMGTSPISSDDF